MQLQEWKYDKIIINSFDELLIFFKKEDTTIEQIKDVCSKGLKIFTVQEYTDKELLINTIVEFWNKWKHSNEKPIFIDVNLECEQNE